MMSKVEKKTAAHHARTLETVLGDLKKSGLKATEPRKSILRALVNDHGPFTAEEIHKVITKRVCDLATVYRTLSSLEKAAIIKRCEFGDGFARYELSQPNEGHHHHVICSECNRVEVVDDSEIENIDRFARDMGFSNVSHSLEFFGICPRCK